MTFVPDDDQADAVYVLCHEPCGVITGGPGRGKTASLKAALPYMGKSVALCAPSGKAARRMAELTNHPASTVHRLLKLQPETEIAEYHRDNPLPYDVVVVDEASTLDNALCAKLLAACDVTRTRVHFIGDVDQLPPVGAGQILADLIASDHVPVVYLRTMHRSASESWVCQNAPRILEGTIDLTPTENFEFVVADDDLVERVVDVAAHYVQRHGRDNVQVVAPMNVGDYGTTVLNPALQQVINPKNPKTAFGFSGGKHARIYEGDDVVVVVNDYERLVFNGEVGRVLTVGKGPDGKVIVDFIDRRVSYLKHEATEFLRLAYALTVHKMQGSEVDWVVLAMHEAYGPMLTRKLLYTAVTRAKIGVVIVGQKDAVLRAVENEDHAQRMTTVAKRIQRLSQR